MLRRVPDTRGICSRRCLTHPVHHMPINTPLIVCLSLALLLVVIALAREMRLRLATQRRTESLLAPILLTLGTAFLCLLPLGIAAYVLFLTRGSVPEMQDVGQILLEELVADQPKLLAPPSAPPSPRLEPPAE